MFQKESWSTFWRLKYICLGIKKAYQWLYSKTSSVSFTNICLLGAHVTTVLSAWVLRHRTELRCSFVNTQKSQYVSTYINFYINCLFLAKCSCINVTYQPRASSNKSHACISDSVLQHLAILNKFLYPKLCQPLCFVYKFVVGPQSQF